MSTSILMRGVVTAINWIRPRACELGTFDGFDAALGWVEARRGRKLSMGGELLADARAAVGER